MSKSMQLTSLAAILMASSALTPANAQNSAEGPDSPAEAMPQEVEDEENVLGAVVVSAQRREQSLQDAPAVINVFDGDVADVLRVDNIENVAAYTPGLKVDGNTRDAQRLGLRGAFGSSDAPGTGQSVAVYVDGVFYGHQSDLGSIVYDVEQVEVLRGPQGTLYGQNVVGGVINITTKEPGDQVEVDAKVSYGNYGRFDIGGRIAGPMSDNLAGSISFLSRNSEGWQENLVTSNRLGAEDTKSFRVKLNWDATADLSAKFIGEYSSDNSQGIPRNIIFGDPERWTVPSDFTDTVISTDGGYDTDSYTLAAIFDYDLGWATLSSISSYQYYDATVEDAPYITDPEAFLKVLPRESDTRTFTQEIRLFGDTNRLNWQVGAFYLDDYARRAETFQVHPVPGTVYYDVFGGRDSQSTQDLEADNQSYSVFGEGTYALLDNVNVTLGARYTIDEKSSFYRNYGDTDPVLGQLSEAPFSISQSEDWGEFTPKLTIDASWRDVGFFDSLLIYGTASKGYKAGGFAGADTLAASTGPFEPETAINYEAGFKTTFLDRAMTLNATAFTVEYSDLQTLSVSAGGQIGVASTDADVWGIEADSTIQLSDSLDLSFAYAYLHNEIADGAVSTNGTPVGGNKLPQSPEHSANVRLQYLTPITADTDFRLTAAYAYKDGVYFDVRNNRSIIPDVFEESKQSIADVEVALLRGQWEFSLWGKNLANDETLLRAFDLSRFTGLTPAERSAGETLLDGVYGTPRTYGISIKWTY